jgi:hypothetical protein
VDRLRAALGTFFDTFVRENRVLPPVVALLALLLFAWVVAGTFVNEGGEDPPDGEAALVQSRAPSLAPEVEDRDADSYAAYRNKDPFRQLLAPAESTTEDTMGTTTPEATIPEATIPGDTTASVPPDDGTGDGTGDGGQTTRRDSDGDGIPNRREERLGLDPRNPDSDADGIDDGEDDSDGNGIPDGQQGGGNGSGGAGAGGGAGSGGNAGGGISDDELFDSGGYVP